MTTTMTANGRERKSLAAQIDRLDAVLDGLADGINDTVVTAVKEAVGLAVRQAVEAALTEILTNPELRRHLQPDPAGPTNPPASKANLVVQATRKAYGWAVTKLTNAWNRLVSTACRAGTVTGAVVGTGVRSVGNGVRRAYRQTRTVLLGSWLGAVVLLGVLRRLRKPVLIALGVGLAIGVACYLAGPVLASVVSGLHSIVLTLAAWALRPVWPRFSLGRDGRAD